MAALSLEQLRPNHLPEPVGLWPPAIGWWLLAAVVLIALGSLALYVYRRWKNNRYRTRALQLARAALNHYQQHQNPRQLAHECNELLKRVALHTFPKERVAGLSGVAWSEFLATTGDLPQFIGHRAFTNDRYNPNATLNVDDIYELTRRWIKKHHA